MASEDRSVQELAALIASRPCVVVAGSYISTLYPAYLPGVKLVLSTAVEHLAPKDATGIAVKEIIEKSLPESYYASAVDILGEELLKLWNATDYEPGETRNVDCEFGPTAIHHALVHFASRFNCPIVTPNYDTLFERAARTQGISVQTRLPGDFHQSNMGEGFAIWKVHGSVESQVLTLLPQITRANEPMLAQLRSILLGKPLVLIGYSGRDIDLFPYLTSWPEVATEIWWIDPCIAEPWHLGVLSEGLIPTPVRKVKARGEDLLEALRVLNELPPEAVKLMESGSKRPPGEQSQEDTRHREKVISALPRKDSEDIRMELLHVRALANIGSNYMAYSHLCGLNPSKLQEPYHRFRFFLTKAQLEHELCLFEHSESTAQTALAIAREFRLDFCEFEAIAALIEARRMQIVARFPSGRAFSSLRDVLWLFYQFVKEVRKFRRVLSRVDASSVSYQNLLASFSMIEHDIRYGSLLQGMYEKLRIPNRVARYHMSKHWQKVLETSLRFGYAAGVANQSKYASRLKIQSRLALLKPGLVYATISDNTGQAIARHDEGRRLLEEGDRVCAQIAFREAAELATTIGDPSLQLKSWIGLVLAGGKMEVPWHEVEGAAFSMQGRVYERIRTKLLATLRSGVKS